MLAREPAATRLLDRLGPERLQIVNDLLIDSLNH